MIRVLLVEYDVHVAGSLEAHLRRRGMETVVCATGEDALAAPLCDVVLANLTLPGMSGVDLLRRFKQRDPALPVLILAGHGTIGDAVAAMRAGARDFLTRPVAPDVLVGRIQDAAGSIDGDDLDLKRRVRALERELFRKALRRTDGKKCHAARLLGIDASNWAYHAKRLDLQ